ncbi:MAG: hypothetical protein GC162_08105 [Planctomycetes bacterium]|nr:hypothetical protein [Planctomycetota bacterium]
MKTFLTAAVIVAAAFSAPVFAGTHATVLRVNQQQAMAQGNQQAPYALTGKAQHLVPPQRDALDARVLAGGRNAH